VKVDINVELLRWARERAGMTVGELSAKFPKLDQWEQGVAKPTLKQVEDYAKATQTPFGYMFLAKLAQRAAADSRLPHHEWALYRTIEPQFA